MNKKKLHYRLVQIKHFPKIVLLLTAVVFALVAVFSLRANNQRMLELRQAVFTADEQDGDIEGALRDLREHVYGHMNTNLSSGENAIKPPIQLKFEYERLLEKEKAKVNSVNANLYTEAQNYCEPLNPAGTLRTTRISCIEDYVDRNARQSVELRPIDESLYKFDFVSPSWSPDLAGWSIVISVLSLATFVVLIIVEFGFRYYLKNK